MPKSRSSRRSKKSRSHKRRGGQFSFSALKDRAKLAAASASQYASNAATNAASSASQYASDMKAKLNSPEMQQKIADYKARASEAANQGFAAAKQGASSAYGSMSSAASAAKDKFNSMTAPPPQPAPAQGGRMRRRRGGNMVTGYNAHNDPFTMNASPVSGYQTAMPQNWVGGRTRRRTRRGARSRRRR